LAPFLDRNSFDPTLRELEVAVPVDLTSQRLVPGPTWTLTHSPAGGGSQEYRLKRVGEPVRRDNEVIARYVPDEWSGRLTVVPGDSLTASLPVSAEGPELKLVWDAN